MKSFSRRLWLAWSRLRSQRKKILNFFLILNFLSVWYMCYLMTMRSLLYRLGYFICFRNNLLEQLNHDIYFHPRSLCIRQRLESERKRKDSLKMDFSWTKGRIWSLEWHQKCSLYHYNDIHVKTVWYSLCHSTKRWKMYSRGQIITWCCDLGRVNFTIASVTSSYSNTLLKRSPST